MRLAGTYNLRGKTFDRSSPKRERSLIVPFSVAGTSFALLLTSEPVFHAIDQYATTGVEVLGGRVLVAVAIAGIGAFAGSSVENLREQLYPPTSWSSGEESITLYQAPPSGPQQ
mgnify:CR=1 FL=1